MLLSLVAVSLMMLPLLAWSPDSDHLAVAQKSSAVSENQPLSDDSDNVSVSFEAPKTISANDLSFEQALIEKAAYLVGGLAWCQAFSGANKRTAIMTCTVFLLQNGYQLNIPQNENPELRQLLFDIQEERGQLDRQVIDKIILYIRKHMSKS